MGFGSRSRSIGLGTSISLAGIAAVLIGLTACPPEKAQLPVAPAVQGASTLNAYKKAGWVPLNEPDSRFVPGTIFQAEPGKFPTWVSSLETCGVPKDVLAPVNSTGGVFESNKDFNYGADALLKIYGVTAGPNFNMVKTVTLKQSDSGPSGIDILKVGQWLRHNPAAFDSLCKSYLSKPNIYVAQESYRIGNATYTLKDSKDAAIKIEGVRTSVVELAPTATAKISGGSSLTLTVPVYTAVHEAIYANDVLDLIEGTRGVGGQLHSADAEINKALPQ